MVDTIVGDSWSLRWGLDHLSFPEPLIWVSIEQKKLDFHNHVGEDMNFFVLHWVIFMMQYSYYSKFAPFFS